MGPLRLIAPVALLAAGAHLGAHSPLSSRQLWATVNACKPNGHPNMIGIRGSMPGDGHPKDTIYMRFQVQYLIPASGHWGEVSRKGDSGFLKVGPANIARQAGTSFQFAPSAGSAAYTLRGFVTFQWRRKNRLLMSTSRTTSAPHKSLAGADPPGYSAATCTLS